MILHVLLHISAPTTCHTHVYIIDKERDLGIFTWDFSLADRGGTKLWQCIAIGGVTIMDTLPALP